MGKMLDERGNMRSLAELKQGLAELEAEEKERKAERVAAGLPADAPPSFVAPEHAEALIEQLRPLYEVLTQYLAMTNQAQQVIPFNVEDFAPYDKVLTLVWESTDTDHLMYAEMIRRSIEVIGEAQGGEVAHEYVISKLYRYLTIAGGCIERNRRPRNITPYQGDDLPQIIVDYWTYYNEHVAEDRRLSRELS